MKGNKKRRGLEWFAEFVSGKGFYIVLFLCVAVIGASAWTLNLTMRDAGLDLNESLREQLEYQTAITLPTTPPLPSAPVVANTAQPEPTIKPEPPAIAPNPAAVPNSVDSSANAAASDSADSSVEASAAATAVDADAKPAPAPAKIPETFVWPVVGNIEQPFAVETLVYDRTMQDWRTHGGIDIAAQLGEKVRCVAAGTVESVITEPRFGTSVTVSHGGGLKSVYRNLAAEPPVGEGQELSMGDVVGAVGNSASSEIGDVSHLHFEMSLSGVPADPTAYLPGR
jgi:murein DD-endopeptidase MepM/ murein hydrolase activator NlpD